MMYTFGCDDCGEEIKVGGRIVKMMIQNPNVHVICDTCDAEWTLNLTHERFEGATVSEGALE